jgi:putative heme-binding domain-containing protein
MVHRTIGVVLFAILATSGLASVAAQEPCRLELEKGDHICLIGNTLAERMQYHGWLEALIHSRFPDYELSFRNLGFSGDELTLRLRSAGFGSPDDHLTHSKADVVWAFFGYNESFAGKEGLEKFKADLAGFIDHTLSQRYNGESAPRLALFSPIAHENLHDSDLPDGSANNERIELYTQAMAEVAAARNVPFVNLFAASKAAYNRTSRPYTINGIHLSEYGDRQLAPLIDQLLFPGPLPVRDGSRIGVIRTAVLEKNFYWYNRYRTVDGYSIYGGRADLAFVDGQTNRVVMDREMEVLDVMTANRDRAIWAAARGQEPAADDANVPPFIPVISNHQGAGPNGTHIFLGAEEAIDKMHVAEGMKINLFASEEMFPEMANPVQMAFDTRGRLWVSVMPSYPHWKPDEPMADKVVILEDVDADGRADRLKVFADGLHVPTGLEFYNGGLFVGQQPCLMYLKDTDGDDVADVRERVVCGIDSADTHHALNSFTLDPGGALYFQEGTFHHTQVETPYGSPERCANAGVFRFEPRTHKFEVYVSYSFANPHGHVFDYWGQDFVTDGTGNVNYFAAGFSGRIDFPGKHRGMEPFFKQRVRPCPATEILASRHFPDSMQGHYLDANVIGFQGILQYRFEEKDSGFEGIEVGPLLQSSDPNFRPVDMEIGPDGALYVADWQNPIIGHMQHNLRDPNRDRTHGRVYRITYPSRPLLKPAAIAGQPIEALLELLKEPENRVRYRAKIELGGRRTADVMAALDRFVTALDPEDSLYQHHLLEALWVKQYHHQVDPAFLNRMLQSPEPRARAAATRVLCYWRDELSNPLELLAQQAEDAHPRVRLEAVRACSFFRDSRAAEVALLAVKRPMDYYLNYTLRETMTQLSPYWKQAIASGAKFSAGNPAGVNYLLDLVTTAELVRLPRTAQVYRALLSRHPVLHEVRHEALMGLAELNQTDVLSELVAAIERTDSSNNPSAEPILNDLAHMLIGMPAADLARARPTLSRLTREGKRPLTRELGWVAVATVDGSFEPAWADASRSLSTLRELLLAVPLVPDPVLRHSAYERVQPLVASIPPEVAAIAKTTRGTMARYVRIELPRKGTLTLAEVEVFSDGVNIGPKGTARQSTESHNGEPARAIDGNKSGRYGDGGQTHTIENEEHPWWELDLGAELPIERIAIWNRTENGGQFVKRLDGYQLTLLSASREEVFKKSGQPAPSETAVFELEGDPLGSLRRAAIDAVVSTGREPRLTFSTLAGLIRLGDERGAAVRAIGRIPAVHWPHEEVKPLLESIEAFVTSVPVEQRTTGAATDALQLANDLTAVLPAREAQAIRKRLRDLAVPVLVVRPVPHLMLFDRTQLFVEAGKPLEIVFENVDIMPHNLIITRPGAMAKVGIEAEKMAARPDAFEKGFVPNLPEVLFSIRLLQPGESGRIGLFAPSEVGDYPYVCTFPGHWRRMYGTLHVVKSLDDVPQDVLLAASAPIPVAATRPFVQAWTLDELSGLVAHAEHGDVARGKELFNSLSCVQCHRMNGVGGQVGPDLAQVKDKLATGKITPLGVLTEMVEPSKVIDEKFRTTVIELEDGRVVSGVIFEETAQELKVRTSPIESINKGGPIEEPVVVIPSSQVVEKFPSQVSLMPQGVLNTLSQEEIVDLLAFVMSAGGGH